MIELLCKNGEDMKHFFKNNIKLIVAFILGLIISGGGVYATTILFNSNQVGYDNSNTNLQINNADVDNVQDAIDAIYQKLPQTCSNSPFHLIHPFQ